MVENKNIFKYFLVEEEASMFCIKRSSEESLNLIWIARETNKPFVVVMNSLSRLQRKQEEECIIVEITEILVKAFDVTSNWVIGIRLSDVIYK